MIASRFRSGSAEDEDLMGPEMNDFRYCREPVLLLIQLLLLTVNCDKLSSVYSSFNSICLPYSQLYKFNIFQFNSMTI
jgi:hypothetical protein